MRLSAVVPVYNMERYLDRCMASLLAQTYTDFEIILVDDGSTDRSGQMCDSYAVGDPKIRVVHQENGGLGMARNRGMDEASGEYVLFLDSDDYFGPDLLRNLARPAEEDHVDAVISGCVNVDQSGNMSVFAFPSEQKFSTPDEMKELTLNTVGAPPEHPSDSKYGMGACARLYKMDVIRNSGIRFESERQLISEDLAFNFDFLSRAGSAVVITDASYFYCFHAGSLSKRHREDRFERDHAFYQAMRERLSSRYAEQDFQIYLDRLLISRARYDIIQEVAYRDLGDRSYNSREKVKKILDHQELRSALQRYPWWKLPVMQSVFTWMMKERQIWALHMLVRLRRRFLPKKEFSA